MRKSVAPRGATPAWGSGRGRTRCTAMSLIAVALTFAMVWSQPATALLPSSGESPAPTAQATMPDADSVTRSGSLPPSVTPHPPARLTGYHQGLLASTVTVPPVATSHPPSPDWIIVMNITGASATPNVGIRGGGGGSHTIYLRYKEVGDTAWNADIFQADARTSTATVPIVMTGLSPNTSYDIQVSFDNTDWSPFEKERFTTKSASATLPTVSSIGVRNITACSAQVNINFPNPSRDSLLVYYSWKTAAEGSTWGSLRNYPSGGDGATVNPGFSYETTYVIGATFDSNFANNIVESAPFTTHSPPYFDRIRVDPIGDTTATVRVEQATFCSAPSDAHFRYKPQGTETWKIRSPGDQRLELTGLTPLTEYVVEASIDSSFETGVVSTTFTTKVGEPSVDSIEIPDADISHSGAKVIVHLDSPNGDAVHIRYSTDPNFGSSSTIHTGSKRVYDTESSAEFILANLTSDTPYYVEASYDDTYPTDKTETANFTTHPPVVSIVEATTTGQTSAQLTITITYRNGQEYTVYSQYRTTPQGGWVNITDRPTTRTDTAVVNVTGLTSDTEYEARASLNSSFPVEETVKSGTFGTWPPGVTKIELKNVTQTTATITVTLSAPNDDSTLYMVYGPENGTWAGTQQTLTSGQTSVDFGLEDLVSGTTYDVRISYDARLLDLVGDPVRPEAVPKNRGSTSNKALKNQNQGSSGEEEEEEEEEVEFTELSFTTEPPTVKAVAIDEMKVSQDSATVAVTVQHPNGTFVYIRYSTDQNFAAGSTVLTDEAAVPAATDPSGISTVNFVLADLDVGTTYYVQASYDKDPFPATDEDNSANFTTKPPSPAVSSVEVLDSGSNEITKTRATARVHVTNPDGAAEVHIRYSTDSSFGQGSIIVTDSATPGTSDTYVDFTFSDLTSGTTYYVEASYDDIYPAGTATESTEFTTDPPAIAHVEVDDQYTTQTGAKVTVEVDEPNNDFPHLHYKTADSAWDTIDPDGPSPHTVVFDANTDTYTFDLTGLSSGTAYTVYASYDSAPPSSEATLKEAQTATFTTVDPNVTDVRVDDKTITQTAASVTVTVDVPNSEAVQLHYQKTSESSWSGPMSATVISATKTATFALDMLTSGSEYRVYGSYDSTAPLPGVTLPDAQTATFTTDPPSVKKVEVTGKTDTTAEITVTIAEPNGETQMVSVRYQTTPSGNWTTIQPDPNTNTATAVVELDNLTANTQYQVEATLSGSFTQGVQATTFTTNSSGPGVSKVVMSGETQTGATATITIANVTAATAVYLQYREPGSNTWSHPPQEGASTTATPGTAVINLSGLASGTQYEVQASLDNTFEAGVQSATFTTEPPSASAVNVIEKSARSAKVRVTVSEPNEKTTLFLRYGTSGNWRGDFASNVSLENVDFTLSGLEPDSTYTVEASFDSTFPQDVTATDTFRTPHLDAPTVDVPTKTQTTATVGITVSSPDDQDGVVYLRYQETPSGTWSTVRAAVVTAGSATARLSGLTSDTEYRVEASLSRSFPANSTGSDIFTTEPPSVDEVEVGNKAETTATVIITISAPNGETQTVYLEYDTTANANENTWTSEGTTTSDTNEATIDLSGLTSGVQYTVRASLTQGFSKGVRTATFTTASNEPGVSAVTITDESHTGATATITVANPGTIARTVYLRYQITPSGSWSDPPLEATSTTATPGSATLGLTGLTSGTQYKVQASLDSTFATGVQTATFRTLRPLVSGVSVTGVSRSEATVTVGVTAPNGDPVFLQYRTGSNEWIGRYANVRTEDSSVEFTLRGLSSSTTYTVQASYDSTFDTDVESDTFTTSATPSTPRPRPRPPGGGGNTGGGNTGGGNTGGGGNNQPPEFMEGTRTVRSVMENTPSGKDIGKPIPADDPENDDLTYSLVGPDAGDFDLEDDSGQLLTRSPLDFETKTHFLVTVSVRDGMDSEGGDDTRRDDQILVAILVTDEDETPNLPPALTETPRTMRTVAENTRPGVAVGDPIEATDPEGDALTYSLNQRDGKYFDIVETSGQLLTRSPLDFETKAGYMVSVSVRDGKDTRGSEDNADDDTIMVTVVVTDQEEPGTVTLSALRPRVGIPLTAVLTDPDGGVTDVGWVWERSEDRAGWTAISDATSTAYTPTTEDEGHYLRVTASYADRRGGSKTAYAEPDAPVTEGIDEEFTDVDDTNVHKPAIDALASQGVFVDTECGDELFCPDLPMTRWAMAVWILRILADEPDTVIGVSRFADIAPGHWWIRYVERLADRKITIGCKLEPFQYCPDRPVTRAQMASFLVRALDLEAAPSAGFTDTDRTVHAANIDALFAAGITIGCTTEPLRYCPYEPVTRAQMATFLYRMAPRLDRQALVAIFDATGGPNWKKSTNWVTAVPISEWYGVGTDSGGRVSSLDLVDNGLNGAIPPEIAILTNLENLKLADNVLLGCIPERARDIPQSDLDGYDLPYCE